MKILIVTLRVRKRTGTEIVTRDYVKALHGAGHEVAVLTEAVGALADEVRKLGSGVFTTIDQLPFVPEVAHFNHVIFAKPLFETFPLCAGVFQHHSPGETVSAEINNPGFLYRFGISPLACEQIRIATQKPDDGWLGNYVDLDQMLGIAQPNPRPKKWLVICQKKRCLKQLAILTRLAWRHGAWLKAVGPRVLWRINNIPNEARRHDLVFASARCALEAASTGAGVIVTDYRGDNGFLTPQNVREMWRKNFGGETFWRPLSSGRLEHAIQSYNPSEATAVGIWLRHHANLNAGLVRLEQIHKLALSKRSA